MSALLGTLRRQHPVLRYQSFEAGIEREDLHVRFHYLLEPDILFQPELVIRNVPVERWEALPREVRDNLIFHLGLMEAPSYWKAACPPLLSVEAGPLSADQIAWWSDLFYHGMGEFYFVNQINPALSEFLTIEASGTTVMGRHGPPAGKMPDGFPSRGLLVPLGGGKDSVVSTELLRSIEPDAGCFLLNPTRAALDIASIGGYKHRVEVKRTIDPMLLDLNRRGYLNGHTPFSAYLAFLSVTCAALLGYDRIAVSNERSSNEGNVFFHGLEVNHQYSKTYRFEQRFREYCRNYLSETVEYFSCLRPLYELQIARLFARSPRYFPYFRSCNRGQQMNRWCEECPKCLFVYAILYPFLPDEAIREIFHQDLFDREDLLPLALELLGAAEKKPLECVGTHEENLAAFYLSVRRVRESSIPLPRMLRKVEEMVLSREPNMDRRAQEVLDAWNEEAAVPADIARRLSRAVFSDEFGLNGGPCDPRSRPVRQ